MEIDEVARAVTLDKSLERVVVHELRGQVLFVIVETKLFFYVEQHQNNGLRWHCSDESRHKTLSAAMARYMRRLAEHDTAVD